MQAGKVTVSSPTWSQCQPEALSRPCVCKQVLLGGVLLRGKMKNLWQGLEARWPKTAAEVRLLPTGSHASADAAGRTWVFLKSMQRCMRNQTFHRCQNAYCSANALNMSYNISQYALPCALRKYIAPKVYFKFISQLSCLFFFFGSTFSYRRVSPFSLWLALTHDSEPWAAVMQHLTYLRSSEWRRFWPWCIWEENMFIFWYHKPAR